MIINLDKIIYDEDSVYSSIEIWSDYFQSIKVENLKDFIRISMDDTDNIVGLCSEFTNFILDTASAKEIGK